MQRMHLENMCTLLESPTHLHLVPRLRMCEVIPPLPQYSFMVWCSVKKNAQEQLYLYLHLYLYLYYVHSREGTSCLQIVILKHT